MNNMTLQALSRQIEADKLGVRVGNYPENPEIEVGLLTGSPRELGHRIDFSVRQTLDFPAVYFQRRRLVQQRTRQLDWEWQKYRLALLLEVRLLCLDLVYTNALKRELDNRLAQAREMAASIERKFTLGEANILEWNKVKLNFLNIQKDVEGNDIERRCLLAELSRLNGGQTVELTETEFPTVEMDGDFQLWYRRVEPNNPQLQWLGKEVECLDIQVKLDRALSLPKLSVGYTSESVANERYQGVRAGLTVPLFERSHTIALSKANATAMRSLEADGRLQFFHQMKAQHERVIAQQKSVQDFRIRLVELDSSPLLHKALESGKLSLVEYLLEITQYYESFGRLLQMERDLAKAQAVLHQYLTDNA